MTYLKKSAREVAVNNFIYLFILDLSFKNLRSNNLKLYLSNCQDCRNAGGQNKRQKINKDDDNNNNIK